MEESGAQPVLKSHNRDSWTRWIANLLLGKLRHTASVLVSLNFSQAERERSFQADFDIHEQKGKEIVI